MSSPAPLPVEGLPLQLFARAAEDDADRLLVCTFEEDAKNGRHPSGVYVSLDGGNSWMRTLLDAHSDWVSETSCEAGTRGRAYFVAGVSNTTHGLPDHATGHTEIFRSFDSGLTWKLVNRFPFIDWTTLLAVSSEREKAEELYLYGHVMAEEFGDVGDGRWIGRKALVLVAHDGHGFRPPLFPPREEDEAKTVYYPLGAVAQGDGSILTLFAQGAAGKPLQYVLYKLCGESYTSVSRIDLPSGMSPTNALGAQFAVDRRGPFRGRLYVAFPAVVNRQYVLGLAISDDQGETWRVNSLLPVAREDGGVSGYSSYAGLAVNREGVVGLTWMAPGGCALFAISTDGGESVSDYQTLGRCLAPGSTEMPSIASAERLWVMNAAEAKAASSSGKPSAGLTVKVRTAAPWSTQVVADANGSFHAFWTEVSGDGFAKTNTAKISMHFAIPSRVSLDDLLNETGMTNVRVVRNQFDPDEGRFDIDLAIQNESEVPVTYPSLLAVSKESSDCGPVNYGNAELRIESGRAAYRVPQAPRQKVLLPGGMTLPLHLEIEAPGCRASSVDLLKRARLAKGRFSPLVVQFEIYSPKQAKGE